METIYEAYTDGACSNNQGSGKQPGGWGVVFLDGRTFSGGDYTTTNNRMELKAAIEALKNVPKDSKIKIYSDSAYVINAFKQNWIANWKKRGWKTSQGKPVENQDLWKELIALEQERELEWVKVKGHSGDEYNEIADQLAVKAIPTGDKARNDKKEESSLEINEKKQSENNVSIELTEENYSLLLKIVQKLADKDQDFEALYQSIKKAGHTS